MNHGWEKKRLGDVCIVTMGQSPESSSYNDKGDGLPFFQGCSDFGVIHPHVTKFCSVPNRIAEYNDILFSVRAPIGTMNFANLKCCIGRGLCSISKKNENQKFIYYALSYSLERIIEKGTGSTFKAVGKEVMNGHLIPIPPIKIQSEVTDELDKINELIAAKRSQLKDLDALAQSLFYETFSEPFINSKGWPVMNFGELASSINYGTSLPAVDGGYYPYIRMNNLTDNGCLDLSNLKYIDIPESELDKCLVRKGDILFNRTNSREKVGKTALFDRAEKMVIAGYIIRVRAKTDMLNPVFAVRYLNLPELKEHLRKICRGAVNQANINSKEMASIPFIVPPINLQNQFASKIEAIEAQKKRVEASIADLETLLASRMDYWFND